MIESERNGRRRRVTTQPDEKRGEKNNVNVTIHGTNTTINAFTTSFSNSPFCTNGTFTFEIGPVNAWSDRTNIFVSEMGTAPLLITFVRRSSIGGSPASETELREVRLGEVTLREPFRIENGLRMAGDMLSSSLWKSMTLSTGHTKPPADQRSSGASLYNLSA